MIEMRALLEELSDVALASKPKTGKDRAEVEERVMRFRKTFDRMLHAEEW